MASIWDKLFAGEDYRTAAPSGGYADLYANSLLGNRTDTPTSVGAMETGKDFIPVLSDVLAFGEAGHALSEGDRKTAAILAAGGLLGTIPGLGPALARPVMAAGRKAADVASRLEVDPNAVGSLLGNVRVKPEGIKAYHGSPHDFDRFSMDAIGTGEGAQAYGHGLYFAENEAVADSYKQSIRRNSDELRRIAEREGGLSGDAAEMLSYQFSMDDFHGKGFDKWLEGLKKSRNDGMLPARSKEAADQIINRSVEASDAVRVMKNPGSMYEVNINANPEDFLDWDAPLSEQSEKVRRAFSQAQAGDDPLLRELLDGSPEALQSLGLLLNSKGSQAYNTLASSASRLAKRPDQLVSQELRDAGIPGIKYKDGMSRGSEGGTQNFVVFDDNLISIVKKYGIAGAAAMLGVSSMDVEQAMAQGAPQDSGLLALREEQKRANEEQYKRGLLQ